MKFVLLSSLLLFGYGLSYAELEFGKSFSSGKLYTGLPEINVMGNGISIIDGDVTPDVTDLTDFGNQSICAGVTTVTFTIENPGSGNLNLGSLNISGVDAAEFSVVSFPSALVSGGGFTTFQVTFDPSSIGLKNAIITVNNDDSDEAVYDFAIQGMGTDPEINVQGNGNTINDGSSTPSGSNHTGFGPVLVCIGTNTRTYTISNSGTGNLVIGAGGITLTGTHAFDYTIGGISLPASIPSGGSTTFTVTSDPSGTGNRLATVNIANNDCSEAVYNFAIQTNGQADATAPVAPVLGMMTSECSLTLPVPTANDNCAGVVSGTTATVFPITTQGTTVVTWTFNDGNGNASTADQTVIIDDVTAPVVPTLSDVAGECSVTLSVPTTTDNCTGIITATTSTSFPVTALGTTVVTWLFDDGNGNTATTTQNVVITDTIDPVIVNCPTTINSAANASGCNATVSWLPPAATDNCIASPILTASHSPGTVFPLGTTAVTYAFDDGNGNSSVCAFNVVVINNLTATASLTDVLCSGTSTGAIELTVSGSSGYSFDWNSGLYATEDIASLPQGTYTVTITDANDCELIDTFTLVDPADLMVTVDAFTNPTTCLSADGTAQISITGGTVTGAYSADWTDGGVYSSAVEDPIDLTDGIFTLTVTDDNGCEETATVTLIDPNGPVISYNATSDTLLTCNGDSDGNINIDVTLLGGATSVNYDWNLGAYSTEDISGLIAGNYSVIVTDNNSCSSVTSFAVNEPAALVVNATAAPNGDMVFANSSLGTYQWIDCSTMTAIPGATSQFYFPVVNGNYAVVITEGACSDTSLCVAAFSVGVDEVKDDGAISVFPNPSNGLFYLSSSVPLEKMELIDLSGKQLLVETQTFQQIDLTELQNGVYFVRVTTIDKEEKTLRLVKE